MLKRVVMLVVIVCSMLLMTFCTNSDEDIKVTFTGDGCTTSGPNKVPIGERTIIFKDISDKHATFWVRRIEGEHTFQELIDIQGTPGGLIPKQDWIISVFDLTDEFDESREEHIRMYSFDTKGEYFIYIHDTYDGLWFCFPFTVR